MTESTWESRLARLEDLEAARALLHRYAITVDAQDAPATASLWDDQGVLRTRMGDFLGQEAITDFYVQRFGQDFSLKRHFICQPLQTWQAPGRVHSESYFLFTTQDVNASALGWGTYDDVIVVKDGIARFELRHIQVVSNADPTKGWPLPTT